MPRMFSGKRDVYLEIAERYARYIQLGILKDGDKLPSVRVAASELGVNPNTVQKAYTHLEEQGLICSLPKKGVFVTYAAQDGGAPAARRAVLDALAALKAQGIRKAEIAMILEEVYADDRD